MKQNEKVALLPMEQLVPHKQNAKFFHDITGDDFALLCDSLAANGMIQPVIVAPKPNGDSYTILSGHQRVRAAKELGWDSVPAITMEPGTESPNEAQLNVLLNANLGRRLSLAEKYRLASHIIDTRGAKKGERNDLAENRRSLTREEVAEKAGITKDDITIINKIKKLPPTEQAELYEWIDGENPNRRSILKRLRQALETSRKYKESDKELNSLKRKAKAQRALETAAEKIRNPQDQHAGEALDGISAEFNLLQTQIAEQLGRLLNYPLPAGIDIVAQAVKVDAERVVEAMQGYIVQVVEHFELDSAEPLTPDMAHQEALAAAPARGAGAASTATQALGAGHAMAADTTSTANAEFDSYDEDWDA